MNFDGVTTESDERAADVGEVRVLARTTADLVAGVWFSLGYVPRQSLLLAVLEGPRERMGLVIRADLPDPAIGAGPLRPLVRALLEGARTAGAVAVVAIVAGDQALGGAGRKARAVLEREAQAVGLRLRDVVGVTSTAFRSLRCSGPPCCPVGGRSIESVMTSVTATTYVAQGAVVAESPAALLADVRGDPAHPGFAARTEDTGLTRAAGRSPGLSVAERQSWWSRWAQAYDAAAAAQLPAGLSPPAPIGLSPPAPIGLSRPALIGLSAALRDGHLRDAVVLHLLGAQPRRVTETLAGRRPDPAEAIPDLDGLLRRRPDPERLRPGEQVLAGCARAAPPGERAPVLAVLALLAWYRGHGARARLLVEEGTRDLWAVRRPGDPGDPGNPDTDAGPTPDLDPDEGDGVSLLDLVEGLLVWAGTPPWVSDRPDG